MSLILFKTAHLEFLDCLSIWICLMFIMIRLRLLYWEGHHRGMGSSSGYLMSGCVTGEASLGLDLLVKAVSATFLTVILLVFPLQLCAKDLEEDSLIFYRISCFWLNFRSFVLASASVSFVQQLLLGRSNGDFSISLIFFTFIIWSSSIKTICHSPHLFIYSKVSKLFL